MYGIITSAVAIFLMPLVPEERKNKLCKHLQHDIYTQYIMKWQNHYNIDSSFIQSWFHNANLIVNLRSRCKFD